VLNRRKKLIPITRQELLETCRPDNLPKTEGAKKRFEDNLDFWLEEELWKKGEDGITVQDPVGSERNLPHRILSLCIKKHADQDICQGNRIEPFLRTITTLLCQDQVSFQGQQRGRQLFENPASIAETINHRLPSHLSINASNEANTLRDWGLFLGFLEPFGGGAITDPTRAITPLIPGLFVENDTLPIRDFITTLAERLPMLDGGKYRQVIEPLLEEKGWQPPLEHRVSASLSHAILRLEAGLQLFLDRPSDDSRSMVLISTDGKERSVGTIRNREAL
jgi:hypothetical protein